MAIPCEYSAALSCELILNMYEWRGTDANLVYAKHLSINREIKYKSSHRATYLIISCASSKIQSLTIHLDQIEIDVACEWYLSYLYVYQTGTSWKFIYTYEIEFRSSHIRILKLREHRITIRRLLSEFERTKRDLVRPVIALAATEAGTVSNLFTILFQIPKIWYVITSVQKIMEQTIGTTQLKTAQSGWYLLLIFPPSLLDDRSRITHWMIRYIIDNRQFNN